VQKQKPITNEQYSYLKKKRFVEGRKNSSFLSFKVIEPTNDPQLKANYIKNRGLDDNFAKKFLYDYIKLGKVERKDIEKFIWDKLPDVLDKTKKKNKVKNLLQDLRKEGKIQSPKYGYWEII
jgi:ATP-dependent DNA helicase RecG